MEEIWKDIPWYEWLYQVSSLGRVKSLQTRWWKKPWIMSVSTNKEWYIWIWLTGFNKKSKKYKVHRLVVSAFLWFELNTSMKEAVIMHLDNNPSNNHLDNLKIWTQSENTKQCIKENRWKQFSLKWETHNMSKLKENQVIEIRVLKKEWFTATELSKKYNMSLANICDILNYKIWKHI